MLPTFFNKKCQKFEYINAPYQSQSNPLLFICIIVPKFYPITYGVHTAWKQHQVWQHVYISTSNYPYANTTRQRLTALLLIPVSVILKLQQTETPQNTKKQNKLRHFIHNWQKCKSSLKVHGIHNMCQLQISVRFPTNIARTQTS